jgi:hypothetical protein
VPKELKVVEVHKGQEVLKELKELKGQLERKVHKDQEVLKVI